MLELAYFEWKGCLRRIMELKPIIWMGSSKNDLSEFPNIIKSELGYGLYYAQIGRQHVHSKSLKGFGGASVLEIIEVMNLEHFVWYIQ